jgi:hypothetical protein
MPQVSQVTASVEHVKQLELQRAHLLLPALYWPSGQLAGQLLVPNSRTPVEHVRQVVALPVQVAQGAVQLWQEGDPEAEPYFPEGHIETQEVLYR